MFLNIFLVLCHLMQSRIRVWRWQAVRWAAEQFLSHYPNAGTRPDVYHSSLSRSGWCLPPSAGINLSQWDLMGSSLDSCSLLSLSFVRPLNPHPLPSNMGKPWPGHWHGLPEAPMWASLCAFVRLLFSCFCKRRQWACFNVHCDASVSY